MTRAFTRWLRKSSLREQDLCVVVVEMACGLIGAQLSAHLFKKRVAAAGRGKRGSARVLIGSNLEDGWFFLLGFEKNERHELSSQELAVLRKWASAFLALDADALLRSQEIGEITEICHEAQSRTQ